MTDSGAGKKVGEGESCQPQSETAAALEQFVGPKRMERLEQVLDNRSRTLTVLLDRVQNHHNISAVLRSADAFGIAEVHLIGESFQYSPTVSQGSERWVRLHRHREASDAVQALTDAGYRLVELRPEEGSSVKEMPLIPITALPFEEKLALVFGNEGEGVSAELQAACGMAAFIPMYGFVESLNISVACALCLYTATIAASAPQRRPRPLDAAERSDLRDEWLKKSVRNSDIILKETALRAKK